MDAVRSARRLAESGNVTVVYRRGRAEMSAGAEEIEEAEAEGVTFLFDRGPYQVVGNGKVEGMVVREVKLSPPGPSGRPVVVAVPGTEQTLPCDSVVIAVGEKADLSGFPAALDLAFGKQGWPQGKHDDTMTGIDGCSPPAGNRSCMRWPPGLGRRTGSTCTCGSRAGTHRLRDPTRSAKAWYRPFRKGKVSPRGRPSRAHRPPSKSRRLRRQLTNPPDVSTEAFEIVASPGWPRWSRPRRRRPEHPAGRAGGPTRPRREGGGTQTAALSETALRLAKFYQGKVEIVPKVPVRSLEDLGSGTRPGYRRGEPAIQADKDAWFDLTGRWNTIAIVPTGAAF